MARVIDAVRKGEADAGVLRASFIPPVQMRQLRLVARQRQKLVGTVRAINTATALPAC